MKKFLACIAIAICTAATATTMTPQEVAVKCTKTMMKGDIDAAAKYMDKSTAQFFTTLITAMAAQKQELQEQLKKQAAKYTQIKAGETKIDGDKATVTLLMTDKDGKVEEEKVELVKEDGEWKFHFKM